MADEQIILPIEPNCRFGRIRRPALGGERAAQLCDSLSLRRLVREANYEKQTTRMRLAKRY